MIYMDELLDAFGWDKKSGATHSKGTSITQLRQMLAPFVLRRIKSDVLDQLVDKECFLEKVPMTEFQRTVYDNILCAHATWTAWEVAENGTSYSVSAADPTVTVTQSPSLTYAQGVRVNAPVLALTLSHDALSVYLSVGGGI